MQNLCPPICQRPLANGHLIVDRLFCKALAVNKVNYENYVNVSCLDIQFVFRNSKISISRYGDFEKKYYSILAQIISKSASLQTICFNSNQERSTFILQNHRWSDSKRSTFSKWIQKTNVFLNNDRFNQINTMVFDGWCDSYFADTNHVVSFENVKRLILSNIAHFKIIWNIWRCMLMQQMIRISIHFSI